MSSPLLALAVLLTCGVVLSRAQATTITKTVYTCSTSTRSLALPTCGWVSTQSTTLPYCFTSTTTASPSSTGSPMTVTASSVLTLPTTTVVITASSPTSISVSTTAIATDTALTTSTLSPTTTPTTLVSLPGLITISSTTPPVYTEPETATPTTSSSTLTATSAIATGTSPNGPCYSGGILLDLNVTATDGGLDTYILLCVSASAGVRLAGGNLIASVAADHSADDCFALCNATPGCNGFDFTGDVAPFGSGPGTCDLRGGALSLIPTTNANVVAAVRLFLDLNGISCPVSNGLAYSAADGSDFVVLCNQDYAYLDSDIPSTAAQTSANLAACIELCTAQGTDCVGVTYSEATLQCNLKQTMIPTISDGAVIQSAVRAGSSEGLGLNLGVSLSSALGLIANGLLTGELLGPWNSTLLPLGIFADLDSVIDLVLGGPDAKLRKRTPIDDPSPSPSTDLSKRAPDFAVLLQEKVNATADSLYFLTFRLGLSGFSAETPSTLTLAINTLTSVGLVDIFVYEYDANQEPTRYYASGHVASDLTLLTFYAEISDGNVPIAVLLDDVVFVTYSTNATSGGVV